MSQLRKISGLLASFVSPTKGDFKRYKDLTEKYIFFVQSSVRDPLGFIMDPDPEGQIN
jgi:hypothetical protein